MIKQKPFVPCIMQSCNHTSMLLRRLILISIFTISLYSISNAQQNLVYVDDEGILRWTETNEEASFFGVNYAAPFAHAYRSLKKLGIPLKDAIDMDVAHLARLEFNAYRIHVWDREVSDKEGNLLENEHIEMLDYLIHKLKERGFYIILTPIAWWGTGWPEPDIETPGFSTDYSKVQMVTEPAARKAQANYIKQFVNHVNKYTNVSYKDDPNVIAFEIINEPHHPKDTSLTAAYIKEMAGVLRSEGITKPIYYNISENWPAQLEGNEEQVAVVYNADIQGISFQWYPTGLVKRSELTGNYLSHVDHYPIPDIKDKNFTNKTRMVYEFDAADKSGSYMYPAMARSFREAGMQWATMFCYDPADMAAYNTEYQTHYLNLLYTPQKALSMLIAANIFKDVKVYQRFNSYPQNLVFGNFKINYENNLSEMNSDEKFYYSNNTSSIPKNIPALEHIAGYGSSPVVKTDSKGCYFLDKIDNGLWRMEVYPDAAWLTDPFGINSLDRKAAEIFYNKSSFDIELPDLSDDFYLLELNGNNSNPVSVNNKKINLKPGLYLLSSNKNVNTGEISFNHNGIGLNDFFLPESKSKSINVVHNTPAEVFVGDSVLLEAEVFSENDIKQVKLFIRNLGWWNFYEVNAEKTGKQKYYTNIPSQFIKNGNLEYCFTVFTGTDTITFPGHLPGNPNQWDFRPSELWQITIKPKGAPVTLFDPEKDYRNAIFPGIWDKVEYSASLVSDEYGNKYLELSLDKIKQPLDDFTFQIEIDDKLNNIKTHTPGAFGVNVISRSRYIDTVYFRYISCSYTSKSAAITEFDKNDMILTAENFKNDKFVLLPRPYPRFLPYYYSSLENKNGSGDKINLIQFTIPMNGFDEKMNGTKIRIGKTAFVPSNR